jgi:hypothetical protein
MKRILLICLAAAALTAAAAIFSGAASARPGGSVPACPGKAAQTIPAWKTADLQRYFRSARRPLVLNLWATFCQPCVEEIPYFQTALGIATPGQAGAPGQADLLLLSLDMKADYPTHIAAFARRHHFRAPIAWMAETDADVYGPAIDATWTGALPATIFYNPLTGYRKFYAGKLGPTQFEEALRAMLAPR